VLERLGVSDAPAIELRDLIGRQAKHLTRLIEDVLDMTRLRHGTLPLQQKRVDLRDSQLAALENVILARELKAQIHPEGRPVTGGFISSYFIQ